MIVSFPPDITHPISYFLFVNCRDRTPLDVDTPSICYTHFVELIWTPERYFKNGLSLSPSVDDGI